MQIKRMTATKEFQTDSFCNHRVVGSTPFNCRALWVAPTHPRGRSRLPREPRRLRCPTLSFRKTVPSEAAKVRRNETKVSVLQIYDTAVQVEASSSLSMQQENGMEAPFQDAPATQ